MAQAILQKLAGRIGVALLLVLLASGTAFAAAATLSTAQSPTLAEPADESESPEATEPAESEPPEATETPEASESPDADDDADADDATRVGMQTPDASPSPTNLARIVERLEAAGITTTVDELGDLAAIVGVGGAVRVLLFADAADMTPAEIVAMFESGKGWGVIARELALDINPGIGSVMGNGHGADKAAKAADKALRAAERAAAKAAREAARAERRAGSGD
jgi:hypothetical protein